MKIVHNRKQNKKAKIFKIKNKKNKTLIKFLFGLYLNKGIMEVKM